MGKHVIFTWIVCHIGIHGNTVVDQEANAALDDINVHIKLILHSK
jgi:ribonuclease HI